MGLGETNDRGPARRARRDSLFLLTVLNAPDGKELGRARVRNMSSTGLMADCEKPFTVGDRVAMKLRGVGDVEGVIAWATADRVGVSFDQVIDPTLARRLAPDGANAASVPDYLRPLPANSRSRR